MATDTNTTVGRPAKQRAREDEDFAAKLAALTDEQFERFIVLLQRDGLIPTRVNAEGRPC